MNYNYESFATEMYCETISESGNLDIKSTIIQGRGTGYEEQSHMLNYLKDKYNVLLDSSSNEIQFLADQGYNLYPTNENDIPILDGGPHAMVIVGNDENGQKYVSSYGKKYIYEPSDGNFYRFVTENDWNNAIKSINNN